MRREGKRREGKGRYTVEGKGEGRGGGFDVDV